MKATDLKTWNAFWCLSMPSSGAAFILLCGGLGLVL
jgi:hypothetical protein